MLGPRGIVGVVARTERLARGVEPRDAEGEPKGQELG